MSQTTIKLALNNVISAIQKIDDAPLSASTHLNTAVVQLRIYGLYKRWELNNE